MTKVKPGLEEVLTHLLGDHSYLFEPERRCNRIVPGALAPLIAEVVRAAKAVRYSPGIAAHLALSEALDALAEHVEVSR